MLLKVAFDGPSWLVQIGNVVQLLYLFLIIVQVIVNLKNKPEAVEKVGTRACTRGRRRLPMPVWRCWQPGIPHPPTAVPALPILSAKILRMRPRPRLPYLSTALPAACTHAAAGAAVCGSSGGRLVQRSQMCVHRMEQAYPWHH